MNIDFRKEKILHALRYHAESYMRGILDADDPEEELREKAKQWSQATFDYIEKEREMDAALRAEYEKQLLNLKLMFPTPTVQETKHGN